MRLSRIVGAAVALALLATGCNQADEGTVAPGTDGDAAAEQGTDGTVEAEGAGEGSDENGADAEDATAMVPDGAVAAWDDWVDAFDDAIRQRASNPQNEFDEELFEAAGLLADGGIIETQLPADAAIMDADVDGSAVLLRSCVMTVFPGEFQTPAGLRYVADARVEERDDRSWEVVRVNGVDRFRGDDTATLQRCITNEMREVVEPFVMDAFQVFVDAMGEDDASVLEQSGWFAQLESDEHRWLSLVLDVMVDPNSREEVTEAGVGPVFSVNDATLSLDSLNQTYMNQFDGVVCVEGPFGVRNDDGDVFLGTDGVASVVFRGIVNDDGPLVLSSAPTQGVC